MHCDVLLAIKPYTQRSEGTRSDGRLLARPGCTTPQSTLERAVSTWADDGCHHWLKSAPRQGPATQLGTGASGQSAPGPAAV
eukprot:363123-Chlamydomonas_euryale.AAC.5